MLPYFIPLSICLILQYKYKLNEKIIFNNRKIMFYIVTIILFLFAALRGNGDGDYYNYKSMCEHISTTERLFNNNYPVEFGFRLLSYSINLFGLNSQWIIIIMNFISITFTYISINKYSEDKILSVLVFFPLFLMFDMHASRTAVAMSICLYGFRYILEKKFIKYFICVFIASNFHKSALITLLLYPFVSIKVNTISSTVILFLCVILVKTVGINELVINILNLLGLDRLSYRFYEYTQSTRFGYEYKLYDPRLMLNVIIYYMSTIFCKFTEKKEKFFQRSVLLGIIISILFSQNTVFVTRLSNFFNIYLIFLIPLICKKSIVKQKDIIRLFFILAYFCYSSLLILKQVEYKLFFL